MRSAGALVALLLLAAGCSAAGPERETAGTETGESLRRTEERGTVIEQIAGGQRGPAERRIVVAGSAGELSGATGLEVPDSGEGLYVSVHAGERPTGGYRVVLSGTRQGELRVALREPGRGEIVTQAITHPYAVAVVRGPEAGDLRFVNSEGERLDWPVQRASGR